MVQPCGEFNNNTTTSNLGLLGLCSRNEEFMKAEMILLFQPPHRPQLLILFLSLSLSLSFIICLALSSLLCIVLWKSKQLYSRGAERTDVAGVEEEAEMSNRSPAAFCKFDSQIPRKKKENEETHKNKSACHFVSHQACAAASSSVSSSCFTGHSLTEYFVSYVNISPWKVGRDFPEETCLSLIQQ